MFDGLNMVKEKGKYHHVWHFKCEQQRSGRKVFCTMFIIQVTWKAEWVGGLTLETHPASKTARCCATERQRKFKLNWILSNTVVISFLILKHGITVRFYVYLYWSPAASPFFSFSFCPVGEKKTKSPQWITYFVWYGLHRLFLDSSLLSRLALYVCLLPSSAIPLWECSWWNVVPNCALLSTEVYTIWKILSDMWICLKF